MKIKKIKARNFSEALTIVRKEMGEDAVILSTEDRKGARSYVEVTAAVDYDNGRDYSSRSFNKPEITTVSRKMPEYSTDSAPDSIAEMGAGAEGEYREIRTDSSPSLISISAIPDSSSSSINFFTLRISIRINLLGC